MGYEWTLGWRLVRPRRREAQHAAARDQELSSLHVVRLLGSHPLHIALIDRQSSGRRR